METSTTRVGGMGTAERKGEEAAQHCNYTSTVVNFFDCCCSCFVLQNWCSKILVVIFLKYFYYAENHI